MALIVKNRVRETTATTGTGALALAGAVSDHRSFASVMAIGDTAWVTTLQPGANAWETGLYTYSAANTLTRTTIYDSTNANAAVNFGAGTKEVFLDLPASKLGSTEAQIDASITTPKIADLNVTIGKLETAVQQSLASTGVVWLTLETAAPSGWLMMDNTTIGPTGSGAAHTGTVYQALFNLFFANLNDTNAPLLTSAGAGTTRAGQTNAATAWAAGCRMSLTKMLGRALAVAGAGSGLTSRAMGATLGEETHALSAGELPVNAYQAPDHLHTGTFLENGSPILLSNQNVPNTGAVYNVLQANTGVGVTLATPTAAVTISNPGGGGAHNNMQPTSFLNARVKL